MESVLTLEGVRLLSPIPALNAGIIRSAAPVLIVSGIVLVIAALSPVRRALGRIADAVATGARPRVIVVETSAEDGAPTGRREIEDFDLDIFLDA